MIQELLSLEEGKTLEFKENARSLPGIIKAVIAFANTAGGTIVIGVEDRTKKVVGVANALDEEERIISAISDAIAPLIVPNIEIQTYRKKELILIHVPHVAGPYYLKSAGSEKGVYVRSGSTNRVADAEMLSALRLYTKKISYDELPYAQAKANALDWDALQEAFAQVDKKITESKAEDLELLVKHANKVSPSYGGIILFGLNRLKIFPDARIRCVRFLGSNKSEVLDHLDIDTYPVLALEEAINFVRKNTSTRAEFGKPRRKDIPEYPAIAVREAIINAIIHADYDIKGSSIMIAIFDDRMEITNPGGIPLGMTLERALAGSSRVRNRVIARVFRELKLIEQWGSGLQRIIDACEKQGLKKPNFEDFVSEFQVTLYATKVSSVKLDASQKKLVDYLTKKKKKLISTKEAADLWDIAPRNARSKLKQLLDVGILKRVGTSANDPLGGYVLIKSK